MISVSQFRIASYNVHSCIGTDRHFAPERIVDALREIDADIVALQELGWHHRGRRNFDQFAFIREMTGYHIIEGPTKSHARAHYGNAILMREPAHAYRTLDLSWPLHIPRGCVIAQTRFGAEPLIIINVHLGLTPWDRARQLKRLIAEIHDHGDQNIIMMGDFNSWKPAGAMFRPLSQLLPHYTALPTFHSRAPRVPLDRIYLSPKLAFHSAEVWRTPTTAKASDHLPVVADITWRPLI
jgi:endonuclease/exonuclease/phosphatase family metal-dependent hydrolase